MPPDKPAKAYQGIIDIGSNSVRLVVYASLGRVPAVVFNEKVLCGLGAQVGATGEMGKKAVESAHTTLRRFRLLCDQMGVAQTRVVATAAVRDAANGVEFVDRVKTECDFDIEIISGGQEGYLAALGVLSGAPDAKGIIGDLGGGSLELARVNNGLVGDTVSLPIGPLRLMSRFGKNRKAIRDYLRETLAEISWLSNDGADNFYMVGGAWRNMAKLMMRERAIPLPVLHGFSPRRADMRRFAQRLSKLKPHDIPFQWLIDESRRGVMPVAALILSEILRAVRPKYATVSTYGLREGLIFEQLPADERGKDPFLYQCEELATERSRFAEHAGLIFDWTRPLFRRDGTGDSRYERLHMAACLLADIAWRGHPDFRAEKAVETMLHGQFVAITHEERAFLAVALAQVYGAGPDFHILSPILGLLKPEALMTARILGAGIRLAQRLSGGAPQGLDASGLKITGREIQLCVPDTMRDMVNPIVERRLALLGQLLGRRMKVKVNRKADASVSPRKAG